MKHLILVSVILALTASTAEAQMRLSFVGADGQPLDTFDETTDTDVSFDINLLRGELVDGVPWHWGYRVRLHDLNGFPGLEDTGPWYQCGSYPGAGLYNVYLTLVPGVGPFEYELDCVYLQNQNSTELGTIIGGQHGGWGGFEPTDFSYMYVHYTSRPQGLPGTGCQKYFLIPINWIGVPVPAGQSTWGRVKSLYDAEGD